jgi:hypothetical protein
MDLFMKIRKSVLNNNSFFQLNNSMKNINYSNKKCFKLNESTEDENKIENLYTKDNNDFNVKVDTSKLKINHILQENEDFVN